MGDAGTITGSIPRNEPTAEQIAANLKAHNDLREAWVDIQSKEFNRQTAYYNLVTIGGYGGAFAIWGFSRTILTPHATAAIALLLTASLAAFVLHEVYKMVTMTGLLMRWQRALNPSLPPTEMLERTRALQKESESNGYVKGFWIWIVQLIIAVTGALGAILLLAYACIATMIGLPVWP